MPEIISEYTPRPNDPTFPRISTVPEPEGAIFNYDP